MKSISKILLVGTFAITAMSLSAIPSEAAKKKKMSACVPTTLCSMKGSVKVCGGDGKWYQALITPVCVEPYCPAKC